MKKYDFDKLANRRNTSSLKWDLEPECLPLWVADMDFLAPDFIVEALQKRVDIKAYGYSLIPEDFYKSVIRWWNDRHHVKFEREWLVYTSGIVAAISSIVRRVTNVGDNVVVMSPVYNIFYNSIINNQRVVLDSPLVHEKGQYHINFNDLEAKLSLDKTSLLIFCNPHNPTGNLWSKEELAKIGELAKKHNVIVVSDEIHCDFVEKGYEYIPFIAANETNKEVSITCVSPSKVFNIAGLQSACIVIPDEKLRKFVERGFNNDEIAEPNFFSMDVNIAAFTKGDEYVDELNEYISNNRKYMSQFIKDRLPKLKLIEAHSTYFAWVDISAYSSNSVEFCRLLKQKAHLFFSDGEEYGKSGRTFIRINLATSLANVKEALNRLEKFLT